MSPIKGSLAAHTMGHISMSISSVFISNLYQHDPNDSLCLQTTALASGLFKVQLEELPAVHTPWCSHAPRDAQVCREESSAETPTLELTFPCWCGAIAESFCISGHHPFFWSMGIIPAPLRIQRPLKLTKMLWTEIVSS